MFLDACRVQEGVSASMTDGPAADGASATSASQGVHFVSVPILCDDVNVGRMVLNTLKLEKNGLNPNGYSKEKYYVDFYVIEDDIFLNLTHKNVLEFLSPKMYVIAVKTDDLLIEDKYQEKFGKYLDVLSLRTNGMTRVKPVLVDCHSSATINCFAHKNIPQNVIVESPTPLRRVNSKNFLNNNSLSVIP